MMIAHNIIFITRANIINVKIIEATARDNVPYTTSTKSIPQILVTPIRVYAFGDNPGSQHEERAFIACAYNEYPDQTPQLRSLIRVFVARLQKHWLWRIHAHRRTEKKSSDYIMHILILVFTLWVWHNSSILCLQPFLRVSSFLENLMTGSDYFDE